MQRTFVLVLGQSRVRAETRISYLGQPRYSQLVVTVLLFSPLQLHPCRDFVRKAIRLFETKRNLKVGVSGSDDAVDSPEFES